MGFAQPQVLMARTTAAEQTPETVTAAGELAGKACQVMHELNQRLALIASRLEDTLGGPRPKSSEGDASRAVPGGLVGHLQSQHHLLGAAADIIDRIERML